QFEMKAGVVPVRLDRDVDGKLVGATIDAPQPLSLGREIAPGVIARCCGCSPAEVVTAAHPPIVATVGDPYVIAEVEDSALKRATPFVQAFRDAAAALPEHKGRFSLHLYTREGEQIRARMFAPLAGTVEDPATGS